MPPSLLSPVLSLSLSSYVFSLCSVTEETDRTLFLAYYSFTSLSHPVVGFQLKGGTRVTTSDWDWSYHDHSCRKKGQCAIASPGFPGIYPPNVVCRYFISTQSTHTRVRIAFTSLQLPEQHCASHFVTLYEVKKKGHKGKKAHDITDGYEIVKKLYTLCGVQRQELTSTGPHLLLEFTSGAQVPPFEYNGFAATLEFNEPATTTTTSTATTTTSHAGLQATQPPPRHSYPHFPDGVLRKGTYPHQLPPAAHHPGGSGHGGSMDLLPTNAKFTPCDMVITDTNGRSGHFDTRGRAFSPTCRFIFKGKPNDVVHISLFNYKLK